MPAERANRNVRRHSLAIDTRVTLASGEPVVRFPTVGSHPVLGREKVSCPACGEKLTRTVYAMRSHAASGCGEMVSLPQLHALIERERRNSQVGPGYIQVQHLREAIEKLVGSKNWFVGGDMDVLLATMEDMSL